MPDPSSPPAGPSPAETSIGRPRRARWHALTLDPKLLLLDEPFEGLSPAIVPLIAEGVASIRAMGKGVLIAESNIHHIPDYVDRLYVLERGEVMFSGTLTQAHRDRDVMRVIAGQIGVAS